uniref:Uncharacterized protein n=1 Tax=Arundo donax TaxID=35708 RepID=A0A0A9EQV9_ARUDO
MRTGIQNDLPDSRSRNQKNTCWLVQWSPRNRYRASSPSLTMSCN